MGHRPRSGRRGISDADDARTERDFQPEPAKCLRLASVELEISSLTIQKVLHEKPGIFPYEIRFLQHLLQVDYPD